MSMPPRSATTRAVACSTDEREETSHSIAGPPTCAARASAFARSMSRHATRAPAAARAAQIPSPRPPPAPVTIATRPSRSKVFNDEPPDIPARSGWYSRADRLVLHLAHRDRAPLVDGAVSGLDERHRLQVVAPRDLRRRPLLERAHQLSHRAGERVREPALLPARAVPLAGVGARRPVDRGGRAPRVVRPADRPLRDALGALDAPFDPVIDPREAVVDRDGAQPVRVLEHVEAETVLVLEVPARVIAHRDEDPLGVAEQEAEAV